MKWGATETRLLPHLEEDSMSADDCFKKAYVKLRYIPPREPAPPADCRQVKITKSPEVIVFTGQTPGFEGIGPGDLVGLKLHCVAVSSYREGAVILLVQVTGYIEWEIEFVRASPEQVCRAPGPFDLRRNPPPPEEGFTCAAPGPLVREKHRIYFSLPMLHKLAGPRIALMAISPLKFRLASYAAQIANAFLKMRQLDRALALIAAPKKGFCPEDIQALEAGLQKLEKELNTGLQWVGSSGGDIASLMNGWPGGTGKFAGCRSAAAIA
jgi:hypothetical protein